MKISFKLTLLGLLFSATTSSVSAVTREECKADYLPSVLECIDSFAGQGTPTCDPLPIPDFAMPQNEANEMGYWVQQIRNTPTSHVFAVSDNSYISMILVDVPPAEDGRQRRLDKKSHLKKRVLEDEEDLMAGPPEDSADEKVVPDGIVVALVDFPPTFQQFDAEGNDAGSHLISALGDILGMLDATVEDVAKVEMIYTHAHSDHIGLATHTYTYMTETLGFDPATTPIIAPEGVLEHMEHAIETGFFTFSAPLPTITFTGLKEHTVGRSTPLTLTTFNGHMSGDKDVVVFMETMGPENPAIMMVVDIVFPKWVPFFSFAISTDLLQYISAHDTLLDFPLGDDGYFVGGHLNQLGDRNDIELNKELSLAMLDGGALALQTVNAGAVVGGTGAFTPGSPTFGNTWLGFGKYFDELERVCARAVIEEYGCDFAALDITVYSSCRMAQSFWRVEV